MGEVVCGGILGTILDCHAAAAGGRALALARGEDGVVGAVTKEYSIQFLRPTPMEPLELVARAVDVRSRSVAVDADVRVSGETCVRFHGVFVAPRGKES